MTTHCVGDRLSQNKLLNKETKQLTNKTTTTTFGGGEESEFIVATIYYFKSTVFNHNKKLGDLQRNRNAHSYSTKKKIKNRNPLSVPRCGT